MFGPVKSGYPPMADIAMMNTIPHLGVKQWRHSGQRHRSRGNVCSETRVYLWNRTAHDICVHRGDEEARFNIPVNDETLPGVTG